MKVFKNKAKFLLSGIKGNDATLLGAYALFSLGWIGKKNVK